jgi:hypothetical protein
MKNKLGALKESEALGVWSLDTSGAVGCGTLAVAKVVEGLVDGIEHGVDVLLEDTSRVVVDVGNVVLNDVGVGSAEESEGTIACLIDQSKP